MVRCTMKTWLEVLFPFFHTLCALMVRRRPESCTSRCQTLDWVRWTGSQRPFRESAGQHFRHVVGRDRHIKCAILPRLRSACRRSPSGVVQRLSPRYRWASDPGANNQGRSEECVRQESGRIGLTPGITRSSIGRHRKVMRHRDNQAPFTKDGRESISDGTRQARANEHDDTCAHYTSRISTQGEHRASSRRSACCRPHDRAS